MKTLLITSSSILLTLIGQGAIAQTNEFAATVTRTVHSTTQPTAVIQPAIRQNAVQTSPQLQPAEVSQKPIVEGRLSINPNRLQSVANSIRVDRTATFELQRVILLELP